MNDAIDVMCAKNRAHAVQIKQIRLIKRRRFAGDARDAVDDIALGID